MIEHKFNYNLFLLKYSYPFKLNLFLIIYIVILTNVSQQQELQLTTTFNYNEIINKDLFKFNFLAKSNEIIITTTYSDKIVNNIKYSNVKGRWLTQSNNSTIKLDPCTTYIFSADVTDKFTNDTFTHTEEINTTYTTPIISDIIVMPFPNALYLHWNSLYQQCVDNYKIYVTSKDYDYHYSDKTKSSEFNVTNLKPCVKYDILMNTTNIYNETVHNYLTQMETDFTDPGPVNNINIEQNDTNSNITVSWQTPTLAPTCIKSYTLKVTKFNCIDDCILKYYTSQESKIEIDINLLDACSIYNFYIHPNPSFNEQVEFISYKTINYNPGPITDLKIFFNNASIITITWNPPILNPTCVKSYRIFWNDNIKEIKEREILIDNLEPCGNYVISVCPISFENLLGECINTSIKMPDDIPSEVLNLEKNFLPGKQQIRWTLPEYAALCIDYYRIAIWYNNGEPSIYDNTTSDNFIDLTDLVACRQHSIQIIPVTFFLKDGLPSILDFETPAKLPEPPEQPEFKTNTKDSLTLSSRYEEEMNKCILLIGKFTCRKLYSSNNETFEEEVILLKGQKYFHNMISNLSPYANYQCSAQVFNSAGWSEESQSVTFQTEEDIPGEPESVNVESIQDLKLFITWKIPKLLNGQLSKYRIYIYPIGVNFQIPSICDLIELENISYIIDATELQFTFRNILSYTNYYVQVAAENGAGIGKYSHPIEITTLPSKPEKVNKFHLISINGPDLSEIYAITVKIEWIIPCRSNGKIISFDGNFIGKRLHYQEHIIEWTLNLENTTNNNEIFTWEGTGFKPEYNYEISISSRVENFEQNSDQSFLEFESPAGIPIAKNMINWGDVDSTKNPTENVIVKISRNILYSEMGEIKYIAFLISERGCQNDPISKMGLIDSLNDWPITLSWKDVQDTDCIQQYQTTQIRWMPDELNVKKSKNESIEYVIGDDENCNQSVIFCNGPLKPGTSYSIVLRVFTKNGYADSQLIYFITDTQVAVLTIVSTVIGLLLSAFLIGFIILWYSRRKINKNENDLPYENEEPTDITIQGFSSYYAEILENNAENLIKEYQLINTLKIDNKTFNAAKLNELKNRYINIYPYDYNRVLLSAKENSTDYINASYINGYTRLKEYIATQGPKVETCYDFWRMIFQCNIDKIIMLTQLKEGDKIKCHEYYPSNNKLLVFEDITIKNVKETNLVTYHKREFLITKNNVKKTIIQYHFQKWPDHDCPTNPKDLIKFIEIVKNEKKSNMPITIHCSAGVGRTGTFIALDIIMQRLKEEKLVNVYKTVKQLRQQRIKMVQNIEQYKFIYKCVSEIITEKRLRKLRKKKLFLFAKSKDNDLPKKRNRSIDIESAM